MIIIDPDQDEASCDTVLVVHRFGAVEVDTQREEVRVDGVARPVEPQVFAVLLHLIEHRDRVVTKEELLDEVWGSRFVSASAVTSRIKSARQAIGDSGRAQELIRTVHGRGYRFVADLDDGAPPAPTPPRSLSVTGVATGAAVDEGWPLTGRDAELSHAIDLAQRGVGGGLLLTGPAGLGKTRLARAVIEEIASRGGSVARINGHADAARVPLAALAHLLPPEVMDIAGLQGELARTVLLQRARAAIRALAGGERLVLMLDDADRVDGLSLTLIGSLISGGDVFAVMTQRTEGGEPLALEHLVRSGEVTHLRLGPVAADQLVALLTRVLDGPVQPSSADTLVSAAGGNPGLLRQLVEASTASGALVRRADVWRLTRPPSAPSDMAAAMGQRLAGLDERQRSALELLAIAGDLDLDLAFDLVEDEVLDELELEGLISVRELGARGRVHLAHPLYGEILVDALPPLRARRHRHRLEEALAVHGAGGADRLRLVRLQLDAGSPIDDAMLLESASLAFIQGHTGLTLRLLDQVPPERRTGQHQQLLGEALYMRGRFDEAGEVWLGMDLDSLDEEAAAFVVRRITTWLFHAHWHHTEALDYLRSQLDRFSGDAFLSVESYWVELAGLDGRHADEAIERSFRSLSASSGSARADYLSGAAMAHFVHGELRQALGLIEECNRVCSELDPSVTWPGPEFANFVEVSAQMELGDIEAAWSVLARITGVGVGPAFGYVSIAAGRLALLSGRYQQVLDWLDPHIQLAETLGIVTNGRPMQASACLAALELGHRDRAIDEARDLRADLPEAPNLTQLDILWAVLQVEAATGDPAAAAAEMIDAATTARNTGNVYIESLLLTAAAHAGAAAAVVDRLGALTGTIDGALIDLRHRATRVLLGDDDRDDVVRAFEKRGLAWDAALLRRA